jgi:hypothetical protein
MGLKENNSVVGAEEKLNHDSPENRQKFSDLILDLLHDSPEAKSDHLGAKKKMDLKQQIQNNPKAYASTKDGILKRFINSAQNDEKTLFKLLEADPPLIHKIGSTAEEILKTKDIDIQFLESNHPTLMENPEFVKTKLLYSMKNNSSENEVDYVTLLEKHPKLIHDTDVQEALIYKEFQTRQFGTSQEVKEKTANYVRQAKILTTKNVFHAFAKRLTDNEADQNRVMRELTRISKRFKTDTSKTESFSSFLSEFFHGLDSKYPNVKNQPIQNINETLDILESISSVEVPSLRRYLSSMYYDMLGHQNVLDEYRNNHYVKKYLNDNKIQKHEKHELFQELRDLTLHHRKENKDTKLLASILYYTFLTNMTKSLVEGEKVMFNNLRNMETSPQDREFINVLNKIYQHVKQGNNGFLLKVLPKEVSKEDVQKILPKNVPLKNASNEKTGSGFCSKTIYSIAP